VLSFILFTIFSSLIIFVSVLSVVRYESRYSGLLALICLVLSGVVFFILGAQIFALIFLILIFLKILIFQKLPDYKKNRLAERMQNKDKPADETPKLPANVQQVIYEDNENIDVCEKANENKLHVLFKPFEKDKRTALLVCLFIFVISCLPIFFLTQTTFVNAENNESSMKAHTESNLILQTQPFQAELISHADTLLIWVCLLLLFLTLMFFTTVVLKKLKSTNNN